MNSHLTGFVNRAVREAERHVALLGMVIVLLGLGLGFASHGIYLVLAISTDPITAAFSVAGGAFVLGLIGLRVLMVRSRSSRQSTGGADHASSHEGAPLSQQDPTTPIAMAAGFAEGFFFPRKH